MLSIFSLNKKKIKMWNLILVNKILIWIKMQIILSKTNKINFKEILKVAANKKLNKYKLIMPMNNNNWLEIIKKIICN
jgi:hypothetical protein